jgi:hypothetical protein
MLCPGKDFGNRDTGRGCVRAELKGVDRKWKSQQHRHWLCTPEEQGTRR